jgi:hypothetical protein
MHRCSPAQMLSITPEQLLEQARSYLAAHPVPPAQAVQRAAGAQSGSMLGNPLGPTQTLPAGHCAPPGHPVPPAPAVQRAAGAPSAPMPGDLLNAMQTLTAGYGAPLASTQTLGASQSTQPIDELSPRSQAAWERSRKHHAFSHISNTTTMPWPSPLPAATAEASERPYPVAATGMPWPPRSAAAMEAAGLPKPVAATAMPWPPPPAAAVRPSGMSLLDAILAGGTAPLPPPTSS